MPAKKRTTKKSESLVTPKQTIPPPKRYEPPTRRGGRPYFIIIIVLAMAVSAAYLLIKGVNVTKEPSASPSAPVEEQDAREDYLDSIVDRVKKHIVIHHEDEEPYIATVGNIELLRQENPVFYKNASQGDKFVAWSDMAVIYSERLDKLVAVATLPPSEMEGPSSTQAMEGEEEGSSEGDVSGGMQEAPEDTTVEIRNGSRVAGAASRLRTSLTGEGFIVSSISDAANTYEGTQIVDLTDGSSDAVLQILTDVTEGSVTSSLPEGEPESDADILILIGR